MSDAVGRWYELFRRVDDGATGALSLLIGVTAILLVGGAIARLWPRTSAAQRHLVWSTACWLTILLPLLQRLVPEYGVRILPTATRTLPADGGLSAKPTSAGALAHRTRDGVATQDRIGVAEEAAARVPWAAIAFTIWAMGTLVVVVPLVRSRNRLSRLDADASPLTDRRTRRIFAEAAAAAGCRRRVELKEHESAMPMAYGLLRPVIVLPRHAVAWTDGCGTYCYTKSRTSCGTTC